MRYEIEDLPQVPKEIINAVENNNLAIFIGAGVSRLVDCDGWDDFAENLLKKSYGLGLINYREKETLLKMTEHKKTITICYHLFNKRSNVGEFFSVMKESLKEGEDAGHPNIYDYISQLRGLCITTNVDSHFHHKYIPSNILYRIEDFDADRLDRNNLYHIHGSLKDPELNPERLIFTVAGYMNRYSNQDFQNFLARIFREYTVLFLGYGLSEFEILDFILRGDDKVGDEDHKKEPKHYMLSQFYRGEHNILELQQAYYNDLNINVIGYAMDDKGYHQLSEVINVWSQKINQVTSYLPSTVRFIDEVVE